MPTLFRQRCQSLAARADQVLGEIDKLLSLPVEAREEDLDDRDLTTARSYLERLRELLLSERLPSRGERSAVMTRIIVDQWPLGTKLGDAISKLEADYRKV